MVDLEHTTEPKSDQLNADDFLTGPKTIKITGVKVTGGDQPVSVYYENDAGKPFKPCKSMRRVLVRLWGKDGDSYAGKSLKLYNDPNVTWAGKAVGGIRISHMSDIKEPMKIALTICKGKRSPFEIKVLEVKEQVKLTDETLKEWTDKMKLAENKVDLIEIGGEINRLGLESDERRVKLLATYQELMEGFK